MKQLGLVRAGSRRMAANGLGIILFRYANWLHGRGYCRNTIHQYTWRAKRHPFSQSIKPSEIAEFLTSHLSRCRCPQPAVTTLQTCRPRINHFPFLLRQRRYLVHKRLLEARQVSKIQQVAGATGDNRKQRELFVVQFQGLIVIHTADEIERLQAGVYGANLHDTLVSPILSSLRSFFPTAEHSVVDSSWSLTADASLKQRPFELTLRIPSSGWQTLYSIGLRIALHTAVDRYRSYLAQANNI